MRIPVGMEVARVICSAVRSRNALCSGAPERSSPIFHSAALMSLSRYTRANVKSAHRNRSRHADVVLGTRRNPERKAWRNQPYTFRRMNFHNAVDRIDKLIGTVGVFWNEEPGGVVVCQSRYGNTAFWIVFTNEQRLAHTRHTMS
jgi:hypothetical protein